MVSCQINNARAPVILSISKLHTTYRINSNAADEEEEEAAARFGRNLLGAVQSAALIAGNLNQRYDEEDVVGVAGAQLANEETDPLVRRRLQQNIPSSKRFETSGKTPNQIHGIGGDMRRHRNNLDPRVGRGMSVPREHVAVPNGSSNGGDFEQQDDEISEYNNDGNAAAAGASAISSAATTRSTPILPRVATKALLRNVSVPGSAERRRNASFTKELLSEGSHLNKAALAFPPNTCSQDALDALQVHYNAFQPTMPRVREKSEDSNDEEE